MLPEYVYRFRARGKDYFYFWKHARTDREWPRMRLPDSPGRPEFWRAAQLCAGLKAWCVDGAWRFTFTGEDGRERVVTEAVTDPALWSQLERFALEATNPEGSFNRLIDEWKGDDSYTSKKPSTRRNYDRYIEVVREAWGPSLVADVRPRDVKELRDVFADRPASAYQLKATLSACIKFGIGMGYRDDNPCLVIGNIARNAEGYAPWPRWACDLLAEHAPRHLFLGAVLALYTGQRQGDCLGMRRNHIENGGIWVTQDKTNKRLWIPIHMELRPYLDEMLTTVRTDESGNEIASTHLLNTSDGTPWRGGDGFRASWAGQFYRYTDKRREPHEWAQPILDHDQRLVFHGLRKNATNHLFEAGCTTAQVCAITGMSEGTAEHYRKGVDQRRLSKAAILKWELDGRENES